MRRVLVMVVSGVALACPAASAGTVPAPTWLPPSELAGPSRFLIRYPDVAVNPNGNAIAVWGGGESGVQARYRPAGGPWQSPTQLASCGGRPRAGVDAVGNATVIWIQCGEGETRVFAATRTTTGVWSSPVTLSTAGRYTENPQLAVASSGYVVASWAETDGRYWVIQASALSPGGSWERAMQLSSVGGDSLGSQAVINVGGAAMVSWTRYDAVGPMVWVASRDAAGWEPAVNLSQPGAQGSSPSLAIDHRGDAIAVWNENGQGQSSFRPSSGSWQEPERFPWFAARDLVFDGDGSALAVWPASDAIWVSERPASGGWGEPVLAGRQERSSATTSLEIAFEGRGAIVIWGRQSPDGHGRIDAAYRQAGEPSWQQPVELVVEGLASDARYSVADDNAVAVWESAGVDRSVSAAILDAGDPEFHTLRVPSRAHVGRRAVFAASSYDISPVRVLWRFGDGTSSRGGHVSHAYRRAGRYRVTVTLADAAGHEKSARRTIVISGAGR